MKTKFTTRITTQLVVACFITLFATNSHAQGIYFNIGGGYGLPAAPNLISTTEYSITDNGNSMTYNYKLLKGGGSFGKGIQTDAKVGYMFTENFGAELGIGYLAGSKSTSKTQGTSTNQTATYEQTMSGSMIRITPALRFSAGHGNVRPYARTGLVIGMGAKVKSMEKSNESNNGMSILGEVESEFSGGLSIGFACGVGVNCRMSNKLGIYAELGVIAQSWAPKKSVITKSVYDGVDELPYMSTSDKETEYVTSYTETDTNTDTSSPTKSLKMNLPFSSAGINVGVHISL